jgi:hypothetical protein
MSGHTAPFSSGAFDVDADPQMLLVLFAVALQGGKNVPVGDEPFKTLKKLVAKATEQGLIGEHKVDMQVTGKTGKVSTKKVAVLSLTDQGQSMLQRAGSPETRAAIAAGQQAQLVQNLDADRAALRQEVLAAVKSKAKGPNPAKLLADVSKMIAQLAERVAKLEAALAGASDDALLARIDAAFAGLRQKVEAAAGPAAHAPSPAAAVPFPTKPESPVEVLRRAYQLLRQLHEFSDGLVPIPRLYHEARRSLPALSVEALHRELQALWDRRELELKILNEVRLASEPDKALQRGDNLYYFVYWPSP